MIETKFKHTDIGLVPVDWEVGHFSDIGDVCMCKRILKEQTTTKGDVPFYKIGTFGSAANAFIPMKLFFKYKNSYNYPSKGDVLISAAGTIGRTAVFDGKPAYFQDSNIVWVDNNQTKILNTYLYYLCNVVKWQTEDGGIVNRLYNDNLRSTIVAYPKSLAEQQRIASALMNIDALIFNLDKLIAKKQAIKKGAMQELLTGKKRLPGFKGEWKECTIQDVLTIGNGRDYKHLHKGNIPVYGTGGIITYVDDFLYDGDTVCIGRKGTIDAPIFHKGKIWTVDTLFYSYDFKGAFPKYIYYLYCTIDWQSHNEATGVPSLSKDNINKIEIKIPNIDEQRAIAHVLSTMDSDISLLAQKRDKYRQIKQGMMRDLLTGRIRLTDKDSMERKGYTVGLHDHHFDGAIAAEPSPQ